MPSRRRGAAGGGQHKGTGLRRASLHLKQGVCCKRQCFINNDLQDRETSSTDLPAFRGAAAHTLTQPHGRAYERAPRPQAPGPRLPAPAARETCAGPARGTLCRPGDTALNGATTFHFLSAPMRCPRASPRSSSVCPV